jgi:light-regulated signal transduction histidine kinase (bacteriophytochrome)
VLGVLADSWLVSHASVNLASVIDIPAAAALGRPLQEIIGKAACQRLRNAEPHRGHASLASQATIERADGTSLDFRARPAGQRICIDIEAAASRAEQKLPLQMTQPALDSFRSAATCEELCALAVRGMKTITGYDRSWRIALAMTAMARSLRRSARRATSQRRPGANICGSRSG